MTAAGDCSHNTDPLRLVREGTGQDARAPAALDPAHAPVNEHGPAHEMVFAQSYAALLKYFDSTDAPAGDWTSFFDGDVSVLLAAAAIEDVDAYRRNTQSWFDYLNNRENEAKEPELKDRFGFLYGSVASLALRLDGLKQRLPEDLPLKDTLRNLIATQLAPAFGRLIAYYKAADAAGLVNDVAPVGQILRSPVVTFDSVLNPAPAGAQLSADWSSGLDWGVYAGAIAEDASVYGAAAPAFTRINHCSTHTLFKAIFDQFLKVFAGVVNAAEAALQDTLERRDTHEPHYALFLAFLRLLDRARASGNALTQRHLDFYYRVILGLEEKGAKPGRVHLLAELAKQAQSRAFPPGELFKAGKDDQGKDAFFASERDVVANRATVASVRTLYRHGNEPVTSGALHDGRLFASPVADSDDGRGAPPTAADGSWHPFFNKVYVDGELADIRMPKPDIGFAIASHYLLMAEGHRGFAAQLTVRGFSGPGKGNFADAVRCFVTTEKGWFEIDPAFMQFQALGASTFWLVVQVDGGAPPIVPYVAKVHGYAFQTDLPMLLVKLKQDDKHLYAYSSVQDVVVESIAVSTGVFGLKSVAASNDFGPVDTSKPFQPFGAAPGSGSSLIIGSKEIFQKNLSSLWIELDWATPIARYPPTGTLPTVTFDFLSAGQWTPTGNGEVPVGNTTYYLLKDLDATVRDEPVVTPNEHYGTQSRYGFVKVKLGAGFGQDDYQTALIKYIRKIPADAPDPGSKPPPGPTARALSMGYFANSRPLVLNTADKSKFDERPARFFHLTPFGAAEQHPYLKEGGTVYLFPQFAIARGTDRFASEAELYIGVAGLAPPQNLSLLFQVADGTANPLSLKPDPHVAWSYLKHNEWIEFDKSEVQDETDDLLNSGLVTLAVPRDATKDNTALPGGLFWIRAAVHEKSDATCRLLRVAAQGMQAVFTDRGNSSSFSAAPLPAGTISKLVTPDSAVKSITQPFPSFGGRGAEHSAAFYTRISERLRHKNRAIDLWDYERLILEAFPQIFQAKCLNHTRYEPSESGPGIYRELAPGHVTIVTLPNLRAQSFRDPLKPYTSLGLLEEIKKFLEERTSCFAHLHVRNPQFEEVRARFSVRLHDGFDETYYSNQLRQAIARFLSPWAFGGSGKPTFGGKVYKSRLIQFVEEQPAVDYVTDFKLFRDIRGTRGSVDLEAVEGSSAVSILVSVPASKHEIAVIKPVQDAALAESCGCEA